MSVTVDLIRLKVWHFNSFVLCFNKGFYLLKTLPENGKGYVKQAKRLEP